VAYAWGDANVGPGDRVIVTEMEHHSNFVPWQQLALRARRDVSWSGRRRGRLDLDALDALLAAATSRSSPSRTSPTSSARSTRRGHRRAARTPPARRRRRRRAGRPAAAGRPRALDADFYAWTGHKAYGPTGIGVLHGRADLLARCRRSSAAGT
jgi:cysteine desulfurase/selenocysteine lyase